MTATASSVVQAANLTAALRRVGLVGCGSADRVTGMRSASRVPRPPPRRRWNPGC